MASKNIHIFDKNLFKILCKIVAQLMTTMQESNKKSKIMQQLCKNVAWFLNIIFENLVYISNIGVPEGKSKRINLTQCAEIQEPSDLVCKLQLK